MKTCLHCGNEYMPAVEGTKYCNKGCGRKYRAKTWRVRKKRKEMDSLTPEQLHWRAETARRTAVKIENKKKVEAEREHYEAISSLKNHVEAMEARWKKEAKRPKKKSGCPKYGKKTQYKTEQAAINGMLRFRGKTGDPTITVYTCKHCDLWHIGRSLHLRYGIPAGEGRIR